MFDQDAPASLLISSPELYYVGSDSTQYKKWSFWISTLEALWSSLVVFFIAFGIKLSIMFESHYICARCPGQYTGSDMGLWDFGTLLCFQLIICPLLQLALETKCWVGILILSPHNISLTPY